MPNLKITLARSPIGFSEQQKRTARALGLNRLNQSVVRPDNAAVRGMVRRISHLVTVQPIDGAEKQEAN
ncbi:MAG: 50S ribosomal protein L30 [Chthonomonadales bacterium]